MHSAWCRARAYVMSNVLSLVYCFMAADCVHVEPEEIPNGRDILPAPETFDGLDSNMTLVHLVSPFRSLSHCKIPNPRNVWTAPKREIWLGC